MRHFLLLAIIYIFGSGCSKIGENDITLLPREYYRPLITSEEIGVAFGSPNESDAIIPVLLQNEKISDAIYITHDNVTLLGVRLKPYYRSVDKELVNEISTLSPISTSSIIVDPRKYRVLERLSKEKQYKGIDEDWLKEWSMLQE
ncbi:hypothetical protein ACFSCX_08725 [Bacillus salitolerans]|uniref:Lipoprotein n=1 Tax=Bacillus salitolerans TaxID=1437434 RepID=A0ABW4LNA4_9BACI